MGFDIHDPNSVLAALRRVRSANAWNKICDQIKEETRLYLPDDQRSGDYPIWWYPQVITSGLLAELQTRWKS